MTFLLRMKAWMLFMFLILPLFLEIALMGSIGFTFMVAEGPEEDETAFVTGILGILFILSLLVSMVIIFGWIYTVATSLYPKLPADHQMKIRRFKFAFFFPMIYFAVFLCLMFLLIESGSPQFIFLIVPFHLFAAACVFYTMYFTAKSLKAVELQRQVTFADYAGEFFLIWFYFIGVWFIQPRINTLFANEEPPEYGGPVDRYLK